MRDKLNFEGFINSSIGKKEIEVIKDTQNTFNYKLVYLFMGFIAISMIVAIGAGIYLIKEDKFKSTIDIKQPISANFNSTTENTFNNDMKLNPIINVYLNQTVKIDNLVVNSVNST